MRGLRASFAKPPRSGALNKREGRSERARENDHDREGERLPDKDTRTSVRPEDENQGENDPLKKNVVGCNKLFVSQLAIEDI